MAGRPRQAPEAHPSVRSDADAVFPRVGWSVGIGYTAACNMRCSFCYSRSARDAEVLPLSAWQAFFDRACGAIAAVNYGTGENTLRADWFELIACVRRSYPRIRQALTTNGHLVRAVSDKRCRELFLLSIDEVDVSLDFADATCHVASRGHPSAFRDAVRCLLWCREQGKETTLVLVGTDETLGAPNLRGLFAIAADCGAKVRVNLYRPVGPVKRERLSYRAVVAALDWVLESHTLLSMTEPLFAALYGVRRPRQPYPRSVRILPNGEITPCTYLITPEWVGGHISDEQPLERIDDSAPFRRFAEPVLPAACQACQLTAGCGGGSPDSRILGYGTLRERSPLCPTRHGDAPAVRRLPLADGRAPAGVHAGYLPTLIFQPGR
jgi:radical SAM protein with 4Fe4S-binding SPASM domain